MPISPETRRLALCARHHLGRTAPSALQATRDLVALHSSDPLSPHLGLWARVPGYRPEMLEQSSELWRLHAMRRTLWVAPAEEVALFDAAVGRTVARRERRRLEGWCAEHGSDWLASLTTRVLSVVAARPGISTRELTRQEPELATRITVGSGKWTSQVAVASRLLFVLAMELKLRRTASLGSWKASQYGWRLAPAVAPMEEKAARRALVRRYLERFAPVSMVDIRWWSGLTAAQVKRALAQLGAIDHEGLWLLPDQELPEARGVCWLPGLDPTPMGYKERDWFLGPHQARLFDRNGNVGPTLWLDGRVVGGWAVDAAGRVRWRLLEPVDEAPFREEGARLERWLAGVSITPRFRTPLERELVG